MTRPLVSVCIPSYNVEKYIGQTIQSVLDQSYKNIEIIIVDDGSGDRSLQIAKQYESGRVKIFSQQNKGASAARNKCLAAANGNYIQFLDGDDLLSQDKIAEQVKSLNNKPGKVAVCSTIHFNDNTNCPNNSPSLYEESFLIDAAPGHFLLNLYGAFGDSGSMVQPNAWLSPIDVIKKAGPWNEGLTLDDDGEYFCRVLLNSKGVIKTGGYNYYRKHNQGKNNLSALKEKQHLESQFKSLNLKIFNLKLFNPSENLEKIHARWLHDLKFKAYPAYPDLLKQLNKDIADLQINYTPEYPFTTLPGKISRKLLGWKIAKRLQLFKQSLKSFINMTKKNKLQN